IDYRRDVYKRLKHNAERHLLGCIDTVCIKFAIQKDGTPTAITIKGESLDEESRKNCRKFIETAGPFRPLWPQNMHEMNVETVLNQLQNESIIVQSLQIESVGNKL
ncbi:MAG TPA: hypothetical protein PKZ32_22005, partial [Candidatus Melainabacteria bacterium]|nr:hypothetical protein [Candidatus Melainabacteria bacterium]